MRQFISNGFTLIELLVVLAIISILAAIAIPAYKDYTLRAVVSEGMMIIQPVREMIEEYHAHYGRFPKDNRALDMPHPEQLISRQLEGVKVINGTINIRYRGTSLGRSNTGLLTVRPALNKDLPTAPIIWACGKAELPGRIISGEDLTNLDNRILPAACRG
ncbi:MAG: pilin [Candidatus Thiodiazotropha sp.]|jgi:type IV pilus assembly protein PilA